MSNNPNIKGNAGNIVVFVDQVKSLAEERGLVNKDGKGGKLIELWSTAERMHSAFMSGNIKEYIKMAQNLPDIVKQIDDITHDVVIDALPPTQATLDTVWNNLEFVTEGTPGGYKEEDRQNAANRLKEEYRSQRNRGGGNN